MKKQVSTLALAMAAAVSFPAFAQQGNIIPCETYAAMEQRFKSNPEAKVAFDAAQLLLEKELSQKNNALGKSSAVEYTIPVVFHILHTGGGENISDATCIAALDWVNKDFAKQHSDAFSVAMPFQNYYVPSDIKFMFAHKDPQGNPTTGIVHRYDTRTIWDRNMSSSILYSGITWNSTRYLNIIIVQDILSPQTQQGVVVGYTWLPGTWGQGAAQDAIVYNHGFLTGNQIRSLSHEIGHWLNLAHTFGNTNNPGVTCGDDGVADTPPTKGNFSNCPSSQSGNSCATTTSLYAAGQTNTENIMDYSSCPKNFTQGQTDRMRTSLASTIANRQNLWQNSNLTITDVNSTASFAPIAEFLSSNNAYTVCAGGSLLMKDYSYNGVATTFQWATDNGAVISAPSNSNTSIMFNTLGVTNVSLTASNAQGSSTKVRSVTVLDGTPAIVGQYFESFEQLGLPPDWKVTNPDAGSPQWDQDFPTFSYDGVAAYAINPSNSSAGQVDILETPIIDMLSNPIKQFQFAYAYARKNSTYLAELKVSLSTDCGGTWKDALTLSASQMQLNSGGVTADPYSPSFAGEWKTIELSTYPGAATVWSLVKNAPSLVVRFKFTDISGQGNNLWLDAINIPGGPTSLTSLGTKFYMNLYPNPANGETRLAFQLHDAADVTASVVNVLGAEVMKLRQGKMSAGQHELTINSDDALTPGVYFVNLSVNGARVTNKLVIE